MQSIKRVISMWVKGVALFLCSAALNGAVFNLPSHLINIPVVNHYRMWDVEYGMSTGFFNTQVYEFDVMASLAVSPKAKLAVNWVNSQNTVFHFHYNILNNPLSKYGIAGGVSNITGNDALSSWNGSEYLASQATNFSPYIVGSYRTKLALLHVGFGGNRFKGWDPDADPQSSGGIFYGFEVPLQKSRFVADFDGKNFNAGVHLSVTDKATVSIALTELGVSGVTNPQYGDSAPVRYFSFGVSHRFNLKKMEEAYTEPVENFLVETEQLKLDITDLKEVYNDEMKQLREEKKQLHEEVSQLRSLIQDDLRYIDRNESELKDDLRHQYLNQNQEMSEKILKYYYESFTYFSTKQHYKAIEILNKAITLNPYLPQLYIRLGSIYYDLELNKLALTHWEKALELDPTNSQLQGIINKVR